MDTQLLLFNSGFLHNFYKCKIKTKCPYNSDILFFNCAEQMYVFYKAYVFNDIKVCEALMSITSPYEQKFLGKSINNFNVEIWDAVKVKIMTNIVKKKFSQNYDLAKKLLATNNAFIAEARLDREWGIGYNLHSPEARDINKWEGKNLMGEILMNTRTHLLNNLL